MDNTDGTSGVDTLLPLRPASLAAPQSNLVLHGPNGLRAGWRILGFVFVTAGIALALLILVRLLLSFAGEIGGRPFSQWIDEHLITSGRDSMPTPGLVAFTEAFIFVLVLLGSWSMGLIEHRRLAHFGLPLRTPFPKSFWAGLVYGFLAISGVLLVMFLLRGFRVTGVDTHGSELALSLVTWAVAFLALGFAEEFLFRGYVQFTLGTGIGFWPAALVLSAVFGLVHASNTGETPFGLVQVAGFGLLACFALRRTGSLWWPIGFHAAWNWGQTFFYGVPDSGHKASHNLLHSEFQGPNWLTGGSAGPEGSVLAWIALLVVAVLLARRYPAVSYPDPTALGVNPS